MQVLGRLMLLHHHHPKRKHKPPPSSHIRIEGEEIIIDGADEQETPAPPVEEDDLPFDFGQSEWWWETLCILREDMLVTLANISGHLNLNAFPEAICMPVLDGLLHWAVCPSASARDPLPTCGPNSVLSPHRLVLESMCKLCVTETNVDLLLATPPFSRMVSLLSILVKLLADRSEQVMREFAIVLLSSLVQGESSVPRLMALLQPSISLLLDFIESAEMQAMQIVNSHGVMMLQDNPEMMGTSLDMLRRAAVILEHMAQVPENRSLLLPHQQRLLHLVMSQYLDQHVARILSEVLFFCSQAEAESQSALPPPLTSGLAL
jgi:AT-rich interactive domain-containing protein 1